MDYGKRRAEPRGGARRLEAGAWRTRQAARPGGGPAPGCRSRGPGGGVSELVARKWIMPPQGGSCAGGASLSRLAIAGETETREAEQHHGPGRRLGNQDAVERERLVEGWRHAVGVLPDDVRADAQPVGVKELITGPALQVGGTGRERRPVGYRPLPRQPKEVAGVQQDLGHEEIVVRGESE